MAVNDLMMRIQLLADTGKSTAKLKRLQTQLQAITNQLKALERTSLSPLANDLKTIKAAQNDLKATNLQTFAKTLNEVKKSFSGLGVSTAGVDQLKQAYLDLQQQIAKTAVETQKHAQETKILNARLAETKKNQLTSSGQSINQQWIDANKELKNYGALIRAANGDIRTERQLILDTKRLLRSANTDYQASLVASGQLDLTGLKSQLSTQKEALKQSTDGVKYYRESLKGLRDDMRNLDKIGKSISAKKLIDTAKLFPGTQINKLTRDFNSTNDLITQLKTNLKSIQDSPLTFRINSTDSVRSIGTIKRAITDTKTAIRDAGKVKFDPGINVGLAGIVNGQKIAFNETFDSLQKFNAGLLKQKSNVSIVNGAIKGYQASLRTLREEAKAAATPNFTLQQSSFGLASGTNLVAELNRVKALMQEIQTIGNKSTITSGITALQNSVRYASAELKATEAATVAPARSKAKSLDSEIKALRLLEEEYKKLNAMRDPKSGADPKQINAQSQLTNLYRQQIEALNPALKNQLDTGKAVKERIRLVEKESALSSYNASLLSQGLDKERERIANSKVSESILKNQNALYRDQAKSIQLAMTAERDRAKQAAAQVKTRPGGILDTTAQLNQQRSLMDVYKANVGSLNEYYQSLKRIAQVTKENAASPLSTLFGELANARKLEESQKRVIANKQKDNEVIRSAIKSEEERYNIITRSQLLNNQLDKKNIQARIDAREIDLKSLQGVTDTVKSRIAGTREEIAANRELVKAKQESLQATIFEAQQRIASGQLTKQQYNEERTAIRAALAEQKDLSRAYQQQLRDKKASLDLALQAEKASATSLKNQVKDLMLLRTEEARSKAVDLTRQYNASQTSQGSLQQQIKETEASAKAEILRANALAQSSKQTKENAGNVLGLKSSLQGGLRPLREFGAALGFMFGPQMAGFAAAGTIIGLTDAFINANKQVELLIRGLNAISGGNGKAEFQYLVDVSNKLGVSIQESAHSFLQLEATTAGTAIEGAKTKQIFESFARALNVTGADAVTFNRAFRSISQSLSKGQLYAEELKGQLAEALPGAIQVFAKAIDVTPKKFLAMVKAGQFAGQTLYDLFGLVANQLDKTYKVGSEKDFTFVQKANLAKNAFVELSVALGETGVWKALSDGMLLLRDGLKSATESIPGLADTLTAEWALIKALYGDGAKELVSSLSIVGDGWRELAKLIPESITNISFQSLLDLPITIQKAANKALVEIRVMAIAVKAELDRINSKGETDTFLGGLAAGGDAIYQFFRSATISAAEAAAATSLYIDQMEFAKSQRSSIMPEGRKARPFTEEMLPFETFLKSYRATNIDVPISVSNETIAKLRNTLDYLQGLLAKATTEEDRQKYSGYIAAQQQRIETEIVLQRQLKDATVQENYNKYQALLRQNEAYEREVLAAAKARAGILQKVESDQATVRQQGEVDNSAIEQQKQIRIETEKKLWLDRQIDKWAQVASDRAKDNQRSSEQGVAEKEKDVAITKNQMAYEKKILDIRQEQRDALVGFSKSRYQEWVKSGSMSQESADFLTKSAENTSALKSIRDAKDAVEAYNAELKKGDAISSDELKLSREKALELLKLGSEKAKQTSNEYEYNKLVEERIRLLGEEKSKANEGAEAVYKAKLKADNPNQQVQEVVVPLQEELDKSPVTSSVQLSTAAAIEAMDLLRQQQAAQPVVVPVVFSGITDPTTTQPTENKATGGLIRGYGGGDRIHALLEQGEFVLRKEAVRKLGLNKVFALNNLNIPKPARSVDKMSIPSFSGGGYMGSSNVININVPGSKSIQVSGSRESAMALANLLTRVGRAT